MGGLKDHLPKTWLAFLIGSLALVGVPIFADFWAKDDRRRRGYRRRSLDRARHRRYVGAFLTGLYTFRMFFLVWYGEPSPEVRAAAEHPHEEDGVDPGHIRLARWRFSPSSPPSAATCRCRARGNSSATGSTPLPSRSSTRPFVRLADEPRRRDRGSCRHVRRLSDLRGPPAGGPAGPGSSARSSTSSGSTSSTTRSSTGRPK